MMTSGQLRSSEVTWAKNKGWYDCCYSAYDGSPKGVGQSPLSVTNSWIWLRVPLLHEQLSHILPTVKTPGRLLKPCPQGPAETCRGGAVPLRAHSPSRQQYPSDVTTVLTSLLLSFCLFLNFMKWDGKYTLLHVWPFFLVSEVGFEHVWLLYATSLRFISVAVCISGLSYSSWSHCQFVLVLMSLSPSGTPITHIMNSHLFLRLLPTPHSLVFSLSTSI